MSMLSKLSILAIDDDLDLRKGIVTYLEDMGHTVYQAENGFQGIDMFNKHHPDLVFTDLMMPEMDGIAVVREIRRISADTPIVAISGNGSVDYAMEAVRQGAWEYITKPILDLSVIDRAIRQVVDRAITQKSEREYNESLKKAVLSQDKRLTEIASIDQLTNLSTRSHLREKFEEFIQCQDFSGDLSIILVEVDNFKYINETFGHECGDTLIQNLGESFKSLVEPNIVVARIGIDGFAVMLANKHNISKKISDVSSLFNKPFDVMGLEVAVHFNIGISTFPQDGESLDSLLQHADIARANARTAGKNQHFFYSSELWDRLQDRISLETKLRKALDKNEFQLYYQPKVDAKTRKIVGMEALLRWQPINSPIVSPAAFIPVLEELGLISEVGEWVINTACNQYVQWRYQGMCPVRMSVNISAIQFHSGNLPVVVQEILKSTGMEPEMLCLELTESIVVKNIDETIESLKMLSRLGIKISIDDFGTGYSSLSYLKDMPIDELKIDRSFVMNLPENDAAITIVESVLGMAKGLNMTVVAEGVETNEQADFLTIRGCHELQGYLFSKPVAAKYFLTGELVCRD